MQSIFDYQHYKDYLNKALFPKGLNQHSSQNIKTLTKKLGYKAPSLLSMILKGQRLPSNELVEKLSSTLKMSKDEKKYFHLLVSYERKKSKEKNVEEELITIEQLLKKHKSSNPKIMDLAKFESIAQWYYLVIKQLIKSDEFREDELWIERKLRKKVRPNQIKKALLDLQKVGAIIRDETGKLKNSFSVTTSDEIPSSAIRQHHEGMILRAAESVHEQTTDERSLQALTLSFNKEDMTDAKREINEFVDNFNANYAKKESKDIYQLNVQFFSHTSSSKENETKGYLQ
jgi:uncharacterized protein (TIGR02147 family)